MIPKVAVLYMEPDEDYHQLQFTCGGCVFFIRDKNQCVLLDPETVTANMGCGLYVGGEPTTSDIWEPQRLVSAKVAGLGDGPFTCKRCEYFDILESHGGRAPCGKGVADFEGDTVHMHGCCNAWEKNDE